ncbi:hypothetical protein V5799_006847 [Amblyomma americanum]|uniref:Uncharacterized protein n=1 Tax=Amblyomma americanum TaxID=6943 RepID=A0AAQ4DV83_AMBAM
MPSQRDSSRAVTQGGSCESGPASSYLNLDDKNVVWSRLSALQAADLYPADECWGGPEHRDPAAEKGASLAAAGGPPPHNYTDPYPGVLLNNATLGPPPVDHSSAYLHGAGAFGATACTGLPCNNGSLLTEGPTYGQDFPDYLYSPGTGMGGYGGMGNTATGNGMMSTISNMASMGNMTSSMTSNMSSNITSNVTSPGAMACTPNDYLLNDLLGDEDLHLMDMVASPTESEYHQPLSQLCCLCSRTANHNLFNLLMDTICDEKWCENRS